MGRGLTACGGSLTRLQAPRSAPHIELFAVSAVFLFLELAFIRWLPAHVLFLTFFTNTVLLASFLGLSLGCLTARQKRNYLLFTPPLLAIVLAAGIGAEWARLALQNVVDVGSNKTAPQMVYFGAEAGARDVSSFLIPIEWIAGAFFALVAATMAGVGQFLGRRFAAFANPIQAYMINIAGSLVGIAVFQCFSWWLSPVWWFGLTAAALIWFLWRDSPRHWGVMAIAAAAPLLAFASSHSSLGVIRQKFPAESWSPYYRINYAPDTRSIAVNLLGHQNMVSRADPFAAYSIPYLLNRDSFQPPFRSVLIIGAGSGNDVSRALQWAAPDAHIDAVEIDPVIKNLGVANHPDHPYQDPRVTLHLNDGRNFLRSTSRKYDLIVFALIDSLVLHSSLSNLRLESYLFTEEALGDVRRALAPNGLFVMYNYFRQGWIVSRLAQTAADAFGRPPLVLTLPERDSIAANEKVEGFTLLFDGPRAAALLRAFEQGEYRIGQIRLKPARVEIPSGLRDATDAWPFLYLRTPLIPSLVWRGIAVMSLISLLMLWRAGFSARPPSRDRALTPIPNSPPRRAALGAESVESPRRALTPPRGSAAMLLLGAGFMLLETKAVVHMALIFGSTWIVNAVVFAAVLIMILIANVHALRRPAVSLAPYYTGLAAALALNILVPLDSFLGWPFPGRAAASGALVLAPVFFAGVVFAALIRKSGQPEQALAWNTAGAMLGGFAENASLWIGFQYLTALAGLIYLASWWASRETNPPWQRSAPSSASL